MRLLLLTLLLHTTLAKRGREFWVKTDNTKICEKPDNLKLQITPALSDPTEACEKEGKICFCVSRDRTTWVSACGQCVADFKFNLEMSKEGILQNLDREVEKKRLEQLKPGKTALNKLGKPEIGLDKKNKHLAKDDKTKLTKSRGYYGRGYAYRGNPVSSKSQSFPKYDAKDLLKIKEIESNRIERNGAKTSRSHMRKHGFGRNFAKRFDRTKTDFKNLSKRLQRVKENVSKALVKDKSVRTAKKTVAKKPAPKRTSKRTSHKKHLKPAAIKNKLAKHLKKAAEIKSIKSKKEAKSKTKPQAKEKFFHGRPTLDQVKSQGRRPSEKPVVNTVKSNAETKPKKPEAKPKKPEAKPKKPEAKPKKPEAKPKKPEAKPKKPETKPKSDEKPVVDKVKKPELSKHKPLRRNDLDDLAESMIKPKRVKQQAEIEQKPSVHKVKPGVIHNEVEQIKNEVEAARKKLKDIAKDFKTKKVDPKILKKNIVQIEKMQKEVDATLKRDKKLLENFEKKSKPSSFSTPNVADLPIGMITRANTHIVNPINEHMKRVY